MCIKHFSFLISLYCEIYKTLLGHVHFVRSHSFCCALSIFGHQFLCHDKVIVNLNFSTVDFPSNVDDKNAHSKHYGHDRVMMCNHFIVLCRPFSSFVLFECFLNELKIVGNFEKSELHADRIHRLRVKVLEVSSIYKFCVLYRVL